MNNRAILEGATSLTPPSIAFSRVRGRYREIVLTVDHRGDNRGRGGPQRSRWSIVIDVILRDRGDPPLDLLLDNARSSSYQDNGDITAFHDIRRCIAVTIVVVTLG
ncbi:hypothetical protein DPMN_128892 [Dreissena polymorpha]|uniref:Uncharacterized protein n=1 Tax=Dreissena polymorpha TaxID=45954 RepID=A0A9D4H4R9_DREPO|nr:hypothetical protein DPMN_128892 [Dreissena polymorpha]